MRPPVNQLIALFVALWAGLVFLAAAPIRAADDAASERARSADGWIPALAVTSGFTAGFQNAAVSSDCTDPASGAPTACDPSDPSSSSILRRGDRGRELAVTPHVGGNLQLSTPALPLPPRPRLFLAVELPWHFGIARNIANAERPSFMSEPPVALESLPEDALLGAGSVTQVEAQGLAFGAGAGMSFDFEAFGRQFWLKPSAGWIRYELEVRGHIERGICHVNDAGVRNCDLDGMQPPDPSFAGFTRVISIAGSDSQWFDGVGPGLELEMETGRVGPFGVSLFAGANAYYIFGDRSVAFTTSRTIGPDTLGDPVTYNGHFSFRVHPWLYRGGLGLRFRWLGED